MNIVADCQVHITTVTKRGINYDACEAEPNTWTDEETILMVHSKTQASNYKTFWQHKEKYLNKAKFRLDAQMIKTVFQYQSLIHSQYLYLG